MHHLRRGVHHLLDVTEILAGATFNHVGRQGPGAAGETNQGYTTGQGTTDFTDRRHDVVQITGRIRHRQLVYILLGTHYFFEFRAFALFEIQPQSHGIRDGQNIGEQDGGIQIVAFQRLQGHFAGQFTVFAQTQKITRLGTCCAVFRQVASCLTHHPDRGYIHRLTQQRTQKAIVFQFSHVAILSCS